MATNKNVEYVVLLKRYSEKYQETFKSTGISAADTLSAMNSVINFSDGAFYTAPICFYVDTIGSYTLYGNLYTRDGVTDIYLVGKKILRSADTQAAQQLIGLAVYSLTQCFKELNLKYGLVVFHFYEGVKLVAVH